MMCNEITAGVMVLIVHDFSDITMTFGRAFYETKFKKFKKLEVLVTVLLIGVWVYMRIIVFPFCLLSNVYVNAPLPTD